MAAKRLRDDYEEEDQDQSDQKRVNRLPSFSTVIREAIMVKSLQNFFMAIEPNLRRVVQEEIQKGLSKISPQYIDRSPEMQMQAVEPSPLRLTFKHPPNTPIFTGSKIEDIELNPLQILLIAGPNGSPSSFPSPIKIELVVLDGDFPFNETDDWTSEDFAKWVVKERSGKRPLLTGDVSNVILRNGVVMIGDLQFTDNSSWIRSRHFRIAVRLVPGSYEGPRIREAITDKFVVRDHRGELYKKHYPPFLHDDVWRLEKIGKDGAFHKKLTENKILNVQDFLKRLTVDPVGLRSILGLGMSDKMWDTVILHAKTCDLGEKIYFHTGQNMTIYLDSICQIVGIMIHGVSYSLHELSMGQRKYVQQLVLEAHQHWNSLGEADSIPNSNVALIQNETVIQGGYGVPMPSWCPINQEGGLMDFQIGGLDEDGASTSFQVAYTGSFHFNQYPN